MKYKAILFDLDGTLMPLSNQNFIDIYIPSLSKYLASITDEKKVIEAMWKALETMLKDTSNRLNEAVFFEEFENRLGKEAVKELEPHFDIYYQSHFEVLRKGIDDNRIMVEAIKQLKNKGYKLIIATNPMFPKIAVSKRISFSSLNENDFDFVSNYSIHTACKPSTKYYEEVLELNNLKPKECLMIGNDVLEDLVVKELGMDAWLLTDYIENGEYTNVADWTGTRIEFLKKVKNDL